MNIERSQVTAETRVTHAPLSFLVRRLCKRYWVRRTPWAKRTAVAAANDVNLEIPAATTLGLVGRSGSGKSTVARCVVRLEKPDSGEIWLGNTNIAGVSARDLGPFRSQIQMIFQDASTAMNSRFSAEQIIEEPLLIQNRGTGAERRERVADLMREVGLSPDWLDRRITEFSGGQRQRIAIARALTLGAKVLVLDEALSSLDLSTQAQIVDLLGQLQSSHHLSYLLISHDLGLVARLAHATAVMSAGRIVEQGATRAVIENPTQPATIEMVRAAQRFQTNLGKSRGAWA